MSLNLHLIAERVVYTKSGKEINERKLIDFFQTPTELSLSLIEKKDFDAILDGYCDWVESFYTPDEYYMYEKEDYLPIEEYEIVSKGLFDKNSNLYRYLLKEIIPSIRIRKQIEQLKNDEYELHWEMW